MRGVVSLAAALSIPVQLSDGVPFPHRNLILFITFIAIITTLLLQGLTLPYLIRKVNMPGFNDYLPEEEATRTVKSDLAKFTLDHINAHYHEQLSHDMHLHRLVAKWEDLKSRNSESELATESKETYLNILEQQRQWLLSRNKSDDKIDEEVIRKFLHQIDLDEEKIRAG